MPLYISKSGLSQFYSIIDLTFYSERIVRCEQRMFSVQSIAHAFFDTISAHISIDSFTNIIGVSYPLCYNLMRNASIAPHFFMCGLRKEQYIIEYNIYNVEISSDTSSVSDHAYFAI